jgi:hypothetical protein
VFRDGVLAAHWRIQTVAARTSDEYAVLLKTLLDMEGFPWRSIDAGSSVGGAARVFGISASSVALRRTGAGGRSGDRQAPILYENPRGRRSHRQRGGRVEELKAGCIIMDSNRDDLGYRESKGEYM